MTTSVSTLWTWIRRRSCLTACATCSMMRVSPPYDCMEPESFDLFVLEGRRPFHHQWLLASFPRFGGTAPEYETGSWIAHPRLRRRVGNSASFLVWLRHSPHVLTPFSSFIAWCRLQRIVFLTVPNEIETWYTRKLPLTYCIEWRLGGLVFQMSWQCQVSPFTQCLPCRGQQKQHYVRKTELQ